MEGEAAADDLCISLGLTYWMFLMRQSYGSISSRKLMANNPRLVTSSVPATQHLRGGRVGVLPRSPLGGAVQPGAGRAAG